MRDTHTAGVARDGHLEERAARLRFIHGLWGMAGGDGRDRSGLDASADVDAFDNEPYLVQTSIESASCLCC